MADILSEKERVKYEKMWDLPKYSERSPGMRFLEDGLRRLQPTPGASFVDLGCGTGRVSKTLSDMGFKVTAVDIAANAGKEFDGPFVQSCLWELPESLGVFDYGYCADVLEHLPTERVPDTLIAISKHVRCCYFQIANFVCHEGDEIGEHLHLTVKPVDWWKETLQQHFVKVEIEAAPKHHLAVVWTTL